MIEFLIIVFGLIVLFWVASINGRLHKAEAQIAALLKGQIKPSASSANQATAPAAAPSSLWTVAEPAPAAQAMFHAQPAGTAPVVPAAPGQLAQSMPKKEDTEDAVNWLNRIGVVALVLGLGFFLKIAISLGWIGPWAQIIIGLAVGGLLVYLGELWKTKFGTRAQALSGGGIAVLYFSIYAAFNFYHLVPQTVAIIAVLAVAAFAVWMSFRNSSLVLAILGFFGAYASPIMFNTGRDQQVMLFVLLTILNVAALAMMLKKYWLELLFLALVGTSIDFALWAGNYSNYQNTLNSLTFVIITGILFVVGSSVLLRYHHKKQTLPKNLENNLSATQLLAGLFYFICIYFLLHENYYNILPAVALLGSIVYFFAYALVDRLTIRGVNYCMSFAGAALLVSAAIWKFDGKALSAVLLVIALAGASVGTLVKREELRVWGLVVLFMALFKSLYDPYGPDDKTFLCNAKFGLMFANTLGLLFVGWLYKKVQASEFEKNVEKGLQIVAALVLWASVSWDIFAVFYNSNPSQNFMTLWWVIYPVALALAAYFSKRKELATVALILLAASFFKVLFLPYLGSYAFLWNAKFGLMALETGALLVAASVYGKSPENRPVSDFLKVTASLLLWFAVSWEIVKYFEGDVSKNARNLYLSLWWIVYSSILMGAGIMWRSALFRKISIGLFGVAIVQVFLYDLLSLDTGYLIVSLISLGVILISVSFVYRKHKEGITKFLEGEKEDLHPL